MKEFKASERKPKASVEIDGKKYEIYGPTVGQSEALEEKRKAMKDGDKSTGTIKLMKEHLSELGKIPMKEVEKLENEMFLELLDYVVNGPKDVKKN